jgi:hypothetical protein
MPRVDNKVCKCPACCAVQPEGISVSRRTWFRHKSAQYPTPIAGTALFLCTHCLDRYPTGHRVSFSTLLRHRKKQAGIVYNERQGDQTEDEFQTYNLTDENIQLQIPDMHLQPTELQDIGIDDTLNEDIEEGEGREQRPALIFGQRDSAGIEFSLERQDEDTLEQLCFLLDAIMMDDGTDETDSDDSDNDIDNGFDQDDPNQGDLAFVNLARLQSKGMSREMYEDVRKVVRMFKVELPSLRRSEARLQHWTKIRPNLIDCCINVCLAYTGEHSDLQKCIHCDEPRYSTTNRIRNRFVHLPLSHRLILQYSEATRAQVLKSYRQSFSDAIGNSYQTHLRDVFDGNLYRSFHQEELGLFGDPHDIALHMSLDGVQVTNIKNHEVYPICSYDFLDH